jgi:hypothetical protein
MKGSRGRVEWRAHIEVDPVSHYCGGCTLQSRNENGRSDATSAVRVRTTSFGGTSPDVFREKVVRSETECIGSE